MEITGKIIKVLDAATGVSQSTGNAWVSQEFVLQYAQGDRIKCMKFKVFGSERLQNMNLAFDKSYTISFDIDAREYNGKWYNDINAYKAVEAGGQQQAQQAGQAPFGQQQAQQNPFAGNPFAGAPQQQEGDGGLPF